MWSSLNPSSLTAWVEALAEYALDLKTVTTSHHSQPAQNPVCWASGFCFVFGDWVGLGLALH